jgi:dCTP deaminase
MFLSHQSIEKYIDEGKIVIKPEFEKKNIRPAGIRVHLAKKILISEPNQTVEIGKPQALRYKEIDLTHEDFYLEPGQFVLGATFEVIQIPSNLLIMLDGRSTIARLGITTHITASIIDGAAASPQAIVLEIKNVGNFRIKLKFKDPIAMVLFAELDEHITQQNQTQYSGQTEVTPPNLNFHTGQDR